MEAGSSIPSRKLNLTYAELHAPLFLGGKNHQLKLVAGSEMKLVYDRDEKELLVSWTNHKGTHEAIVPLSTVLSMWPKTGEVVEIKKAAAPQPQVKAQVETPQDHVFAGPGKGKKAR